MTQLMSGQARSIFEKIINETELSHGLDFSELLTDIRNESKTWSHKTNYYIPEKYVENAFNATFKDHSNEDSALLKIAFSALLAMNSLSLIEKAKLPNSTLAYYPGAFDRMATTLNDMFNDELKRDRSPLIMYTRFLLVLTVPCGAQESDLYDQIPLKSSLIAMIREKSIMPFIRYFNCKGAGAWIRCHTDTQFLDEFNEKGFYAYYLRTAELLLQRKNIRGLVGSSWFYDPQLLKISPRIAYLQTSALASGAYRMKHASSEKEVAFATKTSPTRRKLYEEGKYLPTLYSFIWTRKALIHWAKTTVNDPNQSEWVKDSGVDVQAIKDYEGV